jgi:FixJ family two-component response regulator
MSSIDETQKDIIVEAFEVTTPRSREVLSAYFLSPASTQAAERVGISRRTLAQHVRRFELTTGMSAADAAPLVRQVLARTED